MAGDGAGLGISVRELAERVWADLLEHDITGCAAEMSYYFVLSIFPFLIFLAAVVGMLPFTGAWDGVLGWIMTYFPLQSQAMVLKIVLGLTEGRTAFLSLGLLGTTWAASSGLLSMMSAMNIVYNVKETRSFAKRMGLALLMVLILAILVISTFGLLSVANRVDRGLMAHSMGFMPGGLIWRVARKLVSAMLAAVSIAILDRLMPNLRRPWRRSWPGVAFIVVIWMFSTTGLNLYAEHFGAFNRTYGVLGVFVILMVWIYLSGLVFLSGAEINSELHKMEVQRLMTEPSTLTEAGGR